MHVICLHAIDDASLPEALVSSTKVQLLPQGLIQKQDPKDALLCRAW